MRASPGAVLAALLCLVHLGPAEGQPVLNWQAEVTAGHTDNLFRSYSRRGEWTRQLSLDLACTTAGLELYYWAQADLYDRYPDLFTQTHGLGLSPARPRIRSRLRTNRTRQNSRSIA